ncbi:MAG TPA: hydroxymethylglutaryl-CoA lyase, partial [Brevundimonas sp.]|nr:hydroxymethylglutaryl-CoA lyase [Brevundimonas sp.]
MSRTIEIVEVGPRDGLQNDPVLMPTEVKLDFIDRLITAGVRRMEVASFVNPKLVPAMADSDAIMARVPRDRGVKYIGLALNERGMRRAIDTGCDEVNFVMVASEGFGKANQNATPEDTADLFDRIAVLAHDANIPVSVTISVAFGDPFDGEVPVDRVAMLAGRAARAGAMEIALGDTIGVANPWDVRDRIAAVRAAAPDARLRLHFHNTP